MKVPPITVDIENIIKKIECQTNENIFLGDFIKDILNEFIKELNKAIIGACDNTTEKENDCDPTY